MSRKQQGRFHAARAAAALFFAVTTPFAAAGVVQYQVGDQDFSDGASPVYASDIAAVGAGEPGPFDGRQFGHDLARKLGKFDYEHTFNFAGETPLSATLTIGLLDIDSFPGDKRPTLKFFLDGVQQSADAFLHVSDPNSNSSAEVVTVPVPLSLLADGKLEVSFESRRPRPQSGFRGFGNAIAGDFSTLAVTFEDDVNQPPDDGTDNPGPFPPPDDGGPNPGPHPVPLPAGVIPAAVVMMAMGGRKLLRKMC